MTFVSTDLSASASAVKAKLEMQRLFSSGTVNKTSMLKSRYEQQLVSDRASNLLLMTNSRKASSFYDSTSSDEDNLSNSDTGRRTTYSKYELRHHIKCIDDDIKASRISLRQLMSDKEGANMHKERSLGDHKKVTEYVSFAEGIARARAKRMALAKETSEKDGFNEEEKGLKRVSKAKVRAYARKEKLELERNEKQRLKLEAESKKAEAEERLQVEVVIEKEPPKVEEDDHNVDGIKHKASLKTYKHWETSRKY